MTTPEEIKAEYSSSLADLKFNSKPLINVLTMLAEENSPNAEVIVEAIETHLSKVTTEVKLPILYLIDCIVKNVGGTYTTLFSQNIVSTFCGVFKAVDEKTRAEMFKLRQTWNDVFPPMKLYAIDVQINLLDPAWPVTAKPPPSSIHFNPKFLQKSTPPSVGVKVDTGSTPIDKETLLMQEQLIQKQKELLELQQKKLELEVLQTKVKLQEQFKGNVPHVSMPVRSQNILLKPEVAKQLVPSLKQKPIGISTASAGQQKGQNNLNSNSRLHAINASGSKSIRDPRLLKQQQKSSDTNSGVHLGQETSILNNNKVVTNKMGVRKTRTDPRLIINKDDIPSTTKNETNKPIPSKSHISDTEKKSHKVSHASPRSSGDTSSTKSSSNSSLDSPVKNKSDRLKSVKPKKKDKSDTKILNLNDQNSDKSDKIEISSAFKGVKGLTKNRNYVRRNLKSSSPELPQDEDLRPFGPTEKQPRLQTESPQEKKSDIDSTTAKGMDVDLRQLPAPITRKRSSTDSPEQSNIKKSKTEVLDRLFGNEDTDLRQMPINPEKQVIDVDKSPKKAENSVEKIDTEKVKLPPVLADRPPTPPPPIISSNKAILIKKHIASNLAVVRAKLANATNKANTLSFKKKKLDKIEYQDLRFQKSTKSDSSHKIVISPEDEYYIRSGNMTKQQESQLLQKIIIQMETNKLNEAKKKDHEESLNVLLQPISDEEFIASDDETDRDKKRKSNKEKVLNFSTDNSVISFNDKDERLNTKQLQQKGDYFPGPFYPRDGRDIRRFQGPINWRGLRGRRGHWENQPRILLRPRIPQNNWRNVAPSFPHQRPFVPITQPGPPTEDDKFTGGIDTPNDQLQLTNGVVNLDEIKTMIIDGEPKDIRFYDETAIVFVNWDEPKEISFMDEGGRRVFFNDTDSCMLGFNEPYKDVMINGSLHKVRLGAPSREIYIDHVPYECYFGSAGIRIDLNDVSVTVRLEGPPPQVKIGDMKRTDLVAGKINLFINAKIVVPVFLDAKQQKFFIDDETHTLKFVNSLQTVLINDLPFEVEYGGIPKPIIINGKKNFIRFSVLPKGIKPGKVKIKDMDGPAGVSTPVDEVSQESIVPTDSYEPVLPVIGNTKRPTTDSPERNSNSPNTYQNLLEQQSLNNLDLLSNAITHSFGNVPTTGGYKVENNSTEEQNNLPKVPTSTVPSLNINDLFQKLVASGFVTISASQSLVALKSVPIRNEKTSVKSELLQNSPSSQILPKSKRNVCENLKPILFEKPETLKVCQSALYTYLYSGMQCSSCGMRFSPEASMQYSQHLDWHFRQNRKGKRNIRVAASRRWYYSLSDWKNYEELEDLEEREKNYFDQQQSESLGEETEEEVEVPSVPADPNSTDECCEVCRDKFDQFFNEEKEEWHLKNAIRVEEKTYHPVCYEDYQKSLLEQADETFLESSAAEEDKQEEQTIPGLEIIIDDDDDEMQANQDDEPYEPGDVVSLESYGDSKSSNPENICKPSEEGDDDDVILNEIAPIKIVVDDDDEEYNPETPITDMIKVKKEKSDDGFVEVSGLVSLQNGGQIKIKAEPVDPDDGPLDAPSMTEEHLSADTDVEVVPVEESDDNFTAHSEMVTSIDGNMEIVSSAPSSVTSSGVSANRIKINISKSLPVILNKEKESAPDSGFPTETYIDPSEPFPPGEEPDPIQLKLALKGVNLNKLPPINRGSELTGLCSIM